MLVVFATFAFMIVATVIMIVWPLPLRPWRGVRGTGSTTGLYGMYLGLVFVTIGITFIGITETPAPVHTGQRQHATAACADRCLARCHPATRRGRGPTS